MEYGIDQTIRKLRNSKQSVHLVGIVCIEVGHNVAGVNGVDVQVVVVIVIVVDVVVNIENKSEHLNILGKIKHVMHPMVSLSRVVITNMFSCHTFADYQTIVTRIPPTEI